MDKLLKINSMRKIKLLKLAATVVLCVVIAIVSVRMMLADPRVWVQVVCVAVYVISPVLLLVIWRPFKREQKAWKRILLSIGYVVGGEVAAFLGFMTCIGIGAFQPDSRKPESVCFRTEEDLERITGIDFPAVSVVDSMLYEVFPKWYYEVSFEVDEEDRPKLRANLSTCDDEFWTMEEDSMMEYRIYPDMNFEAIEDFGDFNRLIGDSGFHFKTNGYFIQLLIPAAMDTITLRYGWTN